MGYEYLNFEVQEHVAWLTMNRPPMNPLNAGILKEMKEVIAGIAGNKAIRVLVITGAGDKAFVAGADIKVLSQMTVEQLREFANLGQGVFRSLENLPIPVIAAVNGFALGGGTELAISCDMILASERAMFGQPEVKLGIIPGFGGTQRLARLVGRNMAKELIYRGNIINAEEALRIGLANHVYPHDKLIDAARDMATEIASMAPVAVSKAKDAINRGYHKELDEGNVIEVDNFADSFDTTDRSEGISAFLEKRTPSFTGE